MFPSQEMYTQVGPQFRDELQRHNLPTSFVSRFSLLSACHNFQVPELLSIQFLIFMFLSVSVYVVLV